MLAGGGRYADLKHTRNGVLHGGKPVQEKNVIYRRRSPTVVPRFLSPTTDKFDNVCVCV